MADVVFTDSSFENEVMKSQTPVLVDFWAPWCGPCKMVSPVVEELAAEYVGKMKIGKLNVDDNPETAGKFNVMSIPTLMFFKKGEPIRSIVGAQGKEVIKEEIEEVIAL